jgi:hypothetical protein
MHDADRRTWRATCARREIARTCGWRNRKRVQLEDSGIPVVIWRTGWDLNPRQPCGCTAFPVPRLRPDSATRPA